MSHLLFWIALPLFVVPIVTRRDRRSGATGQIILAGLGLAALLQGAGTLDPADLRSVAGQSSSLGWFIGSTIGMLITGACLVPFAGGWRRAAPALPLLLGLVLSITIRAVPAVLLGGVAGCIPAAVGRVWRRASGPRLAAAVEPASAFRPDTVALAVAAVALARFGPVALSAAAWIALCWLEWSGAGARRQRRLPVLPLAATALLVGWLWLALTIAGDWWIGLPAFAVDAPVSIAAALLLGGLAILWGLAAAAPWSLERRASLSVQLPVVAVVLYLVAGSTPEGTAHWQPLASLVLVLVAIAGAATDRPDGAASALVLLAATRPGAMALVAALLASAVPLARRLAVPDGMTRALAGAAAAGVVAAVLRDQVVLAVVLGFGLTAVANRYDGIVAPV